MSKAREGLDKLLELFPEADLAWVRQQNETIMNTYREQVKPSQYSSQEYWLAPGPWLCVDLFVRGRILQFAIWNETGNVYRVAKEFEEYPGSVSDDPIIIITKLGAGPWR